MSIKMEFREIPFSRSGGLGDMASRPRAREAAVGIVLGLLKAEPRRLEGAPVPVPPAQALSPHPEAQSDHRQPEPALPQ
jgi:hypothetical protein